MKHKQDTSKHPFTCLKYSGSNTRRSPGHPHPDWKLNLSYFQNCERLLGTEECFSDIVWRDDENTGERVATHVFISWKHQQTMLFYGHKRMNYKGNMSIPLSFHENSEDFNGNISVLHMFLNPKPTASSGYYFNKATGEIKNPHPDLIGNRDQGKHLAALLKPVGEPIGVLVSHCEDYMEFLYHTNCIRVYYDQPKANFAADYDWARFHSKINPDFFLYDQDNPQPPKYYFNK
jgi:hypothetical protein